MSAAGIVTYAAMMTDVAPTAGLNAPLSPRAAVAPFEISLREMRDDNGTPLDVDVIGGVVRTFTIGAYWGGEVYVLVDDVRARY